MRSILSVALLLVSASAFCAPADLATEAYAHYEATNEVSAAKVELNATISAGDTASRNYALQKKKEAIEASTNYTDTVTAGHNQYTDSKVAALSNAVVSANYATQSVTNGLASKAYVDSADTSAKDEVKLWTENKGYAQQTWVEAKGYANADYVDTKVGALNTTIDNKLTTTYLKKTDAASTYATKYSPTFVDNVTGHTLSLPFDGSPLMTRTTVSNMIEQAGGGGSSSAKLDVIHASVSGTTVSFEETSAQVYAMLDNKNPDFVRLVEANGLVIDYYCENKWKSSAEGLGNYYSANFASQNDSYLYKMSITVFESVTTMYITRSTSQFLKNDLNSLTNSTSFNTAVETTVNKVKAEFYDEPLSVNWTVKMVNGEMKLYATTNVNMSTLPRYTNWSTDNLPSGVTWAAQPTYDDGIDLWEWAYNGGTAQSEEGGADATSLTFGYGEGFTTTRSVIQ